MLVSSIPSKFGIPFANGAGAGYIRPIPQASQIGVQAGAASLTDGFPPVTFIAVDSGGTPPWGADWNGILNQITAWNRWHQAAAPIYYDAAFATAIGGYPAGATLLSTGNNLKYWVSTADNNTSNPDSGGANWAFGSLVPFTPVQQGTGVSQLSNIVKLGWDGSYLRATVDATDLGPLATQTWANAQFYTQSYCTTNFVTYTYLGANYHNATYSDANYATYAWVNANFYTATYCANTFETIAHANATYAHRSGDTFLGAMQFNSNIVIGTGSSASPIGDQVNGCGWNTTTFQSYGAGSHFQIGMGNGFGTGDFLELYWNVGFRSNNLVGSISLIGGGSGTAFNTTSDYRLKDVHGPADGSLIDKLRVYDASWKAKPEERRPMILAHEAQEHAPWAVTGEKDAVYGEDHPRVLAKSATAGDIIPQQLDYQSLIPAMIRRIQELGEIVAAQQEIIAEMRTA